MALFVILLEVPATLVGFILARASYIAVPAAMRISVLEPNPTLSLTVSLGIIFSFKILIGIPLYYHLSSVTLPALGIR